jgi:hypothetical protein
VIDVETIENLIDGPAGAELLGSPTVERGPVGVAGLVNLSQIWRWPTGEHVGTGPERCDDHGTQAVALGEARPQ